MGTFNPSTRETGGRSLRPDYSPETVSSQPKHIGKPGLKRGSGRRALGM